MWTKYELFNFIKMSKLFVIIVSSPLRSAALYLLPYYTIYILEIQWKQIERFSDGNPSICELFLTVLKRGLTNAKKYSIIASAINERESDKCIIPKSWKPMMNTVSNVFMRAKHLYHFIYGIIKRIIKIRIKWKAVHIMDFERLNRETFNYNNGISRNLDPTKGATETYSQKFARLNFETFKYNNHGRR